MSAGRMGRSRASLKRSRSERRSSVSSETSDVYRTGEGQCWSTKRLKDITTWFHP